MLLSFISVLALAWLAAAADYYKILDGMSIMIVFLTSGSDWDRP